ncbi:MAG TPA: hypothetical protein VEQ58_14910 [Polyangiaceae bacterium]|nr:hypothetical protein [Polyangiaceae bacterium]
MSGGGGSTGVGGSGSSEPSVPSTSGNGSGVAGNGPTCPKTSPDYRCADGVENGVACGPRRSDIKLLRAEGAVYLLEKGAGIVLRVATADGDPSVVETGGGVVQAIAVDEPYVYWASDRGLGRTRNQAGEPAELLSEPCVPSQTSGLVSDGGLLYWSSYAPSFQSAMLAFDTTQTNRRANVLFQGALGGTVLGSDAANIYAWSGEYLAMLAKNTRCHCACAASTPGAALSCETADGVKPTAGTAGAPSGYYEDCGGQHVSIPYRPDSAQIQRAALDDGFFYWSSTSALSRLPKNSPDLLDPLTESPGEPTVLLARASDHETLGAFTLDGDDIYAHRMHSNADFSNGASEIVRLAKDGSQLESVFDNVGNPVSDLVVDDTNVYVATIDACTFTLKRFPKP